MKANYLRARRHHKWGAEPGLQPEYVPESEADRARRKMREWLRTETSGDEFEDAPYCLSCGRRRATCDGC